MAELVLYPAVALVYYFGVMRASCKDYVELNDSASANVFCLFVIAQPLCLVLGGYTGMTAYLLTALISYNFLPWKEEQVSGNGCPGSPKKEEVNKKNK